ncbi:MAG: hypothetical protein AB1725_02185 [Armatimonadota bacterium]
MAKVRQRGSAILVVLVLVSATAVIVIAAADLTISAMAGQWRRYHQIHAHYVADAAVEWAQAKRKAGTLALPANQNLTIDGSQVNVVVSDNSVSLKRSLRVETTVKEGGLTFKQSRVVGDGIVPKHFYYALACEDQFQISTNLTTGSGGRLGDIFCNNKVTITALGVIVNGDLEVVGSLSGTPSVTGSIWNPCPSIAFPMVNAGNYAVGAIPVLVADINGWSFTPTVLDYETLYAPGNANLSGTYDGKGVIFVANDIRIVGDVHYADNNSVMAVIALNSITVEAGVTHIDGYYFAGQKFTSDSPNLTLGRGSIVTSRFDLKGALTATYDPWVWNDPEEGKRLKLPGFWP